jgi:hypothetical protein
MRTFDVYKHPVNGYQAVKQGFSWPAFFFMIIWAFVKQLWKHGLALLGVLFVLTIMESAFAAGENVGAALLFVLAQFGLFVFAGFNGNDWRRSNLIGRGFAKVGSIPADTADGAIGQIANMGAGSPAAAGHVG